MNTLLNEMQRYLQVIERAEADPEVWGKLTEGTGIATANGYRAALKAAAQPVAPEQAPTAAMVRKIMHEELAALSENATPCDDDEILLTKSSERIAARLASQQVKGYSVDEVRALMAFFGDQLAGDFRSEARPMWHSEKRRMEAIDFILANKPPASLSAALREDTEDTLRAARIALNAAREWTLGFSPRTTSQIDAAVNFIDATLASLSAKGEAPKEKYGAVVRAEDGAPYDALAELIKRGIKLARLRADIKSDVEDAFYSQTVAIEIDGVRTTAVTHERFNRMLNVLYDRWLPRSTPAAPEGTVSAPVDLRAVLLAYEQWEADVIADNACWGAEGMSPYPILCDGHWDRFIEIQSMRNEALGTWSKVAPVTNSVDSSLSVKDANQNAVEASEGGEGICDRCGGNGFVGDGLERCPKCEMPDAEEGQAAAHSGVVEVLRRVLPILEKHSLWAFQLASDALAAPKEGERPEPFTDHDLLQMANAWAEGTPYPTPDRTSFVAGVKAILKAKPNPEAFVAALRAVRSELEREAMGLTYEGAGDYDNGVRRGLLSAVDQLDPILTQWEASQPSPDSPKN